MGSRTVFPRVVLLYIYFQFIHYHSTLFLFQRGRKIIPVSNRGMDHRSTPSSKLARSSHVMPGLQSRRRSRSSLTRRLSSTKRRQRRLITRTLRNMTNKRRSTRRHMRQYIPRRMTNTIFRRSKLAKTKSRNRRPQHYRPRRRGHDRNRSSQMRMSLLRPLTSTTQLTHATILKGGNQAHQYRTRRQRVNRRRRLTNNNIPNSSRYTRPVSTVLRGSQTHQSSTTRRTRTSTLTRRLPMRVPTSPRILFLQRGRLSFNRRVRSTRRSQRTLESSHDRHYTLRPRPRPNGRR